MPETSTATPATLAPVPIAAPPYLTVDTWADFFPIPEPRTLRHLLFQDPHGFRARCVRKAGRLVMLSVADVFAWLDERRDDEAADPPASTSRRAGARR